MSFSQYLAKTTESRPIEPLQKRTKLHCKATVSWLRSRFSKTNPNMNYLYFPEEVQKHLELEKIFKQFDEDGSGKLQMDEFYNMLLATGFNVSPKDLRDFYSRVDVDSDLALDFKEFKDCTLSEEANHQFNLMMKKAKKEPTLHSPVNAGDESPRSPGLGRSPRSPGSPKRKQRKYFDFLFDEEEKLPKKSFLPRTFGNLLNYITYRNKKKELKDTIADRDMPCIERFTKFKELIDLQMGRDIYLAKYNDKFNPEKHLQHLSPRSVARLYYDQESSSPSLRKLDGKPSAKEINLFDPEMEDLKHEIDVVTKITKDNVLKEAHRKQARRFKHLEIQTSQDFFKRKNSTTSSSHFQLPLPPMTSHSVMRTPTNPTRHGSLPLNQEETTRRPKILRIKQNKPNQRAATEVNDDLQVPLHTHKVSFEPNHVSEPVMKPERTSSLQFPSATLRTNTKKPSWDAYALKKKILESQSSEHNVKASMSPSSRSPRTKALTASITRRKADPVYEIAMEDHALNLSDEGAIIRWLNSPQEAKKHKLVRKGTDKVGVGKLKLGKVNNINIRTNSTATHGSTSSRGGAYGTPTMDLVLGTAPGSAKNHSGSIITTTAASSARNDTRRKFWVTKDSSRGFETKPNSGRRFSSKTPVTSIGLEGWERKESPGEGEWQVKKYWDTKKKI